MATVNFYLKEPNSVKESLILAKYNSEGLRFKLSTGEKILPTKWNQNTHRAKKTFSGYSSLNQFLDSVSTEIQRIKRDNLGSNVKLTSEIFKTEFSQFLGKVKEKKEPKIIELLDEFLKVKKDKLSFNYLRSVNTLRNHLENFEKEEKFKLSFDKINLSFYELFTSYLFSKGQTNNTVGTNISRLKRFLDWSTDMGFNSNLSYKERGFKAIESETEFICLTEKELFEIYELDLSNNKRLHNVREAFCFGCFTGLRFSDIEKLRIEDIKEDELKITIQKTRETISIPLSEYAREILTRNNFNLPVISNQKTNDYLKELGKLAKINEPVKLVRFRGATRIEETDSKYNLISTHTARRTFVTLCLEKGMRPEVVMSITGHKSYKNFKKYIKLTDKVKKIELQKVWSRPHESLLKVI